MTDLYELLDRLQATASGISGWELASERGNLSEAEEQELAAMKRTVVELDQQARVRWASATPFEVAAYDARVDALARQSSPDPILSDAKRRAPQTRSPTRTFDAWAIWITLKLG